MTPPPLETDAWQRLFAAVTSLLEAEAELPVRPPRALNELVEALALAHPAEGRPEVIDALVALGRTSPATATPRSFNQLFAGRLEAATMADMLAALLNNSMTPTRSRGSR